MKCRRSYSLLGRALALLVATLLVPGCGLIGLANIKNGLDAQMMTFESEPPEGWAHWEWFFLKLHLFEYVTFFSVIGLLMFLISRGWMRLWRDISVWFRESQPPGNNRL